ncbi:MAG: IMP dehydrogenase [Deltaproteobacteria bacterium]|nr:IMP dehydrogenase [Deltaproteobacteria bacterium]
MSLPDVPLGLTYDDVLLVPQYSEVVPSEVDTSTEVVEGIGLKIPILSSAMDTVTEAGLAIAMARAGGLGILHKNMDGAAQAAEVRRAKELAAPAGGAPAQLATVDAAGRLRVGAAVGVGHDREARVAQLVEAGVDLIVVDTAHGHSRSVLTAVAATRHAHPRLPIIAGNVATAEATRALVEAGASGVKVGIGPGSICTTRVVAGVGVPQLTAIFDCAAEATRLGIPLVADGGVRYSGDVVKALAAGAHTVMVGSLLAATAEAPGEVVDQGGAPMKRYRGMGSVAAMQAGSADRYFQAGAQKLVAEGVEGLVPLVGDVAGVLFQLVGGVRSGMGYVGASSFAELRRRARFVRVTDAGVREGHAHDLASIDAAPNYSGRS